MKLLLTLLLTLYISSGCHDVEKSWKGSSRSEKYRIHLSNDSGYIRAADGLPFLSGSALIDTVKSNWEYIESNDTIGKYYKLGTGNFLLCAIDMSKKGAFANHLLIEINPQGKAIRSERFMHGNYSCCWRNYYEGFQKYTSYYGIKICGTGSGYCASYLYMFKEIKPQKDLNPIPLQYYSGYDLASQNLNSTMEFKPDSLIMHYRVEDNYFDDSLKHKIKVRKFDVLYQLENGKWATKDTSKLAGLDLWLTS